MDVLEAIEGRRSVRAFLDTPVPPETISAIIEAARWAPSGVNTQPWRVMSLGPKTMARLGEAIVADCEAGHPNNPDYDYYVDEWTEPYLSRRRACGYALYGALGIEKSDMAKRKAQWYANFHFFGAPCGLMFFIDAHLEKGSWLDTGMFLENVMLAARGHGLDTCAQAALAERPDIVREICDVGPEWHVVCGMSLGYADWSHPVNQYRTAREPLSSFYQALD